MSHAPPASPAADTGPAATAANASNTTDATALDAAAPKGSTSPAPEASTTSTVSRAERFFTASACLGPLVLVLLLALQAWPFFWSDIRVSGDSLQSNALFCPREAQSIAAYDATVANGQWRAPMPSLTDGQAQWPAYTIFLAAVSRLSVLLPGNPLYPTAALLSTIFALLGVWSMSRAAGFGPKPALAAGLMLLCAPLFAPLSHFAGPEALTAGLMLFSLASLYMGLQKERAFCLVPAGFALAALAGLSGGPFPLLLPLATALFFLLRRGAFRRIQAPDALMGFTLLLLIVACWLIWVILDPPTGNYLADLASRAFQAPVFTLAALKQSPLYMAAVGFAPWLILTVCVSWGRVLSTAKANFTTPTGGADFIWISLMAGCLLSLCVGDGISAAVCLVCLAAPVAGKALLRLSSLGSRFFYIVTALLLLHAGMALVAAAFGPSLDWMVDFFRREITPERRELILSITTLPVLGVICIVAAITLTRLTKRERPAGALMVCVLYAVILAQPAGLIFPLEAATHPDIPLYRAADIYTQTKNTLAVDTAPASDALPTVAPAPDAAITPAPETAPSIATPETMQAPALAPENAPVPGQAVAPEAAVTNEAADGAAANTPVAPPAEAPAQTPTNPLASPPAEAPAAAI